MRKGIFVLLVTLIVFSFGCVFASSEIEIPDTIRVKMPDGRIEKIDMDTYLYSVVQSEMGLYYRASGMKNGERVPLEALKAQAVASRSYAVYNMLHAGADAKFDVTSTTSSQVYKEGNTIDSLVKQAVDETSGQVIMYDGEVACAYFFSTSGGHTEASENVWYAALPYLRGVEDKYEIEVDGNSSWEVTYTASEIENKFPEIGELEKIKIIERSENDRVIELKIVGSDASKVLLKNGIRTSLGSVKLKSQWFDVEFDGKEVVFTGKGFGHGIGMSQNGAIGMALEGFTYDEILEWYYTDVDILGFQKKTSSRRKDDKEEKIEEIVEEPKEDVIGEEEEIVIEPKPMLERLTAFCTTNWLLKLI